MHKLIRLKIICPTRVKLMLEYTKADYTTEIGQLKFKKQNDFKKFRKLAVSSKQHYHRRRQF